MCDANKKGINGEQKAKRGCRNEEQKATLVGVGVSEVV
jgi:hypothetical protein